MDNSKSVSCLVAWDFLFTETFSYSNTVRTALCCVKCTSKLKRHRIESYWETIVPLYDTCTFQRLFRMKPHTLEELARNIFPYVDYNSNVYTIPHEKKVGWEGYVCAWEGGSGCRYRDKLHLSVAVHIRISFRIRI